jgi:hypothetical protein
MAKYDIEFILPVSNKDQYRQRLLDFKKIGLLNVQNKKVLVDLLIGPERVKNINDGWPSNVDVKTIPGEHRSETAKIYNFFADLRLEDADRSRWYTKFDDDSVNDVSGLVDHLDLEYDHNRDYYIVTEFRPEQHKYEDRILHELGYQRWFRPHKMNTLWHELEGSIVSQAGLKRILSNETAVTLMRRRAEIPEGYSDYCLACAARICKIYPSDAYFLSKDPLIGEFSLFGGFLTHLHAISHDRNVHAYDLLQRMLAKKMRSSTKMGDELHEKIVNQEFVYSREPNSVFMIRLRDDGLIEKSDGREKIWHITDAGHLEFLTVDGVRRVVFDNFDDTYNVIGGYCSFQDPFRPQGNPELKPFLRRLA